MRRLMTAIATLVFASAAQAGETTGAGSTFVYPIIAKWAADYQAKTANKVYKQPKNPNRAALALDFFKWSLENGQKQAEALDYVPMPANVVQQVEAYWKTQFAWKG